MQKFMSILEYVDLTCQKRKLSGRFHDHYLNRFFVKFAISTAIRFGMWSILDVGEHA